MVVGLLTVRLAIYGATSVKDKRRVIKSIKDRVRGKFNAAIAETDALEAHQRAVLTVATVSNDAQFSQSCLQQILNFINGQRGAALIDYQMETL